jgi:hypothetical protein
MKKIIVLLIVVVSFNSCQLLYEIADNVYEERYNGQELVDLHLGNENFKTIEDIGRFLKANISYVKGIGDYAQSPKETWETKTGNCGSFTVILMNIAFFELGIECSLAIVDHKNMIELRTVENGGLSSDHIMILYEGVVYSPQNGSTYEGQIDYSLTFSEIFN